MHVYNLGTSVTVDNHITRLLYCHHMKYLPLTTYGMFATLNISIVPTLNHLQDEYHAQNGIFATLNMEFHYQCIEYLPPSTNEIFATLN